jgi:hypothetical protein
MVKFLIFSLALICISVAAGAATDGAVNIYGKLKNQNNDAITLETEDAIVIMPKRFMSRNAKMGQKISIAIPKDGFKDMQISPLKK